jgi:hypothetical protein
MLPFTESDLSVSLLRNTCNMYLLPAHYSLCVYFAS